MITSCITTDLFLKVSPINQPIDNSLVSSNILSLGFQPLANSLKKIYPTADVDYPDLTLKKPISKKKIQEFNPHFSCKQINFKKKYQKKNLKIYQDCRPSTKKDRFEILKICKENTSNSRFVKDSFFRKLLKYPLRYYWLENSFRNKPGKFLIVCLKNKKIGGFCLLQKIKKKLNINIICTSKKFSNQKIGSSIIAYINNKIMKKYKIHLYAGTQDYNTHALSFYKKK